MPRPRRRRLRSRRRRRAPTVRASAKSCALTPVTCTGHAHAMLRPPQPPPRNRSVRATHVRVTLHGLHTQGLSRSPQTVRTNTEAADHTCWSAACAYADWEARKTPVLGGGGSGPVQDHRVQDPTKAMVTVLALCSRLGGCPTQYCRTEGRTREPCRCVTGFAFRSPPPGPHPIGTLVPRSHGSSLRASGRRVAERRRDHR